MHCDGLGVRAGWHGCFQLDEKDHQLQVAEATARREQLLWQHRRQVCDCVCRHSLWLLSCVRLSVLALSPSPLSLVPVCTPHTQGVVSSQLFASVTAGVMSILRLLRLNSTFVCEDVLRNHAAHITSADRFMPEHTGIRKASDSESEEEESEVMLGSGSGVSVFMDAADTRAAEEAHKAAEARAQRREERRLQAQEARTRRRKELFGVEDDVVGRVIADGIRECADKLDLFMGIVGNVAVRCFPSPVP